MRWLQHHELVLRSSPQTINRYRTATEHLLRFVRQPQHPQLAGQFHVRHAEEFVRYLRALEVAPNGHSQARKRPLLDKGVKFILETCRALFNYAGKQRHLSPYADNPFATLEVDRIPLETTRPVVLFSAAEEQRFMEACDAWQFPLFLTLLLTGLRPGELTYLLLPDELAGIIHRCDLGRCQQPSPTAPPPALAAAAARRTPPPVPQAAVHRVELFLP